MRIRQNASRAGQKGANTSSNFNANSNTNSNANEHSNSSSGSRLQDLAQIASQNQQYALISQVLANAGIQPGPILSQSGGNRDSQQSSMPDMSAFGLSSSGVNIQHLTSTLLKDMPSSVAQQCINAILQHGFNSPQIALAMQQSVDASQMQQNNAQFNHQKSQENKHSQHLQMQQHSQQPYQGFQLQHAQNYGAPSSSVSAAQTVMPAFAAQSVGSEAARVSSSNSTTPRLSKALQSSGRKVRAGVPQSDFRGVSWDRSVNTWRCKVNSVHVGYFDSEVEAARAYDEATLSLHKPGCGMQLRLNFPFSDYKDKPSGSIKYETKRDGRARGSSKYRGVLWDKASKSWRAKIKHQGHTKYLGLYQDEAAAGRAYDTAALELRGTAAKLNFPDEHAIDTAATLETPNVVAPNKGRPLSITVPESALSTLGTLGKRSPRVDLEGVAAKYARVMERHASRRESYQQVCQKLQFFDQRVAGAAASDDTKQTLSSSHNDSGPSDAAMPGTEDGGLLNADVLKLLIVNAVQIKNSKQTAKPESRTAKKTVSRASRRRGRARNKSRMGKASGNNEGSSDNEAVADDDDDDDDDDANGSDSSYKDDDDDVEEEEDEEEDEEDNGKNDGKVRRKKGKTARNSSKDKVQLDLGVFLEDIKVKVEEEVRAFLEKNKIAFREEKKKSPRRAGK